MATGEVKRRGYRVSGLVQFLLCKALHNRKNFLFAGNDTGGERAAAIYTLIETCRLNGVEPFAYLCDVLEKLPAWPHKRLSELLPFNWKPSLP